MASERRPVTNVQGEDTVYLNGLTQIFDHYDQILIELTTLIGALTDNCAALEARIVEVEATP